MFKTLLRSVEHVRLEEARDGRASWKRWGPYLSERQWGTVREDYSDSGNAWDYFTHDHARSRAYRWGEDGLGRMSDDHQRLCFATSAGEQFLTMGTAAMVSATGPAETLRRAG